MTVVSGTTQLPAAGKPLLTLTRESDAGLWTIELHNGEDNRLSHDLIDRALKPALDIVEREWRDQWRQAQASGASKANEPANKNAGRGALIIVGKRDQNKFFSNGLDYVNAIKDPNFFKFTYNPLLARLLTFPIPVVCAINGHCFAGGLMFALACDFRVMTDGKERRAWCCMNEVHFGAPWPFAMAALANAKVSDARTRRLLALEGHRFSPQEALAHGLIDVVADDSSAEAVYSAARKFAIEKSEMAKTGVWGLIKSDLHRHTLDDIAQDYRVTMPVHADAAARSRL